MSLNVIDSELRYFPDGSDANSLESSTVMYRVTTDCSGPSWAVINAAIEGNHIQGQNAPFNIRHEGITYNSEFLFAARYECKSLFEQYRSKNKYDITVTYETISSTSSSGAPTTFNPNLGQNPLLRPTRRNIEYDTIQEPLREARNVDGLRDRPENTLGPIVNGAGFPIPERRTVARRIPVLTIRKNVSGFLPALAINRQFDRTVNDDVWNDIPTGAAKFLSATTQGPFYWNSLVYFELDVRVAVDEKGLWFERFDNEGDRFWEDGNDIAPLPFTNDDGSFAATGILTFMGAKGVDATTIRYATNDSEDYDALDTAISNYS